MAVALVDVERSLDSPTSLRKRSKADALLVASMSQSNGVASLMSSALILFASLRVDIVSDPRGTAAVRHHAALSHSTSSACW